MIHQTHLNLPDGKYAVLYRFPKRGDGLSMHKHEGQSEYLQHAVLCTQGRVAIYGPGKHWCWELSAGEDLRFDSSQLHEICALEDGSHVLNVLKHGRPAGYEKLPANELDSSVEMTPLTEGTE
jgi:hypothetical protein